MVLGQGGEALGTEVLFLGLGGVVGVCEYDEGTVG